MTNSSTRLSQRLHGVPMGQRGAFVKSKKQSLN
ncbi:hypothetical protein PAP18089_02232 [Pandoraea apista]|uniref:Uncharacterized protein n=1 Tax=Pandoraea apista TaxID=93218 RepID=A0A5E5P476_9BURK|nr:hypothetical protein LMG16407_04175 [Pandoraea apista]VVG71257.1 hypothetical protein PAP18089_02232 [Pandoraea apista]